MSLQGQAEAKAGRGRSLSPAVALLPPQRKALFSPCEPPVPCG